MGKRLRLKEDEYELIKEYRGIKNAANESNVDIKDVKHGWLKTKTTSLFFKNPAFDESNFDLDKIDWNNVLSGLVLPPLPDRKVISDSDGIFDRLVYTDVHIGMNPNPSGYSQYGGKWDEDEIMDRACKMVEFVAQNRRSKGICIDDLGDLMDGWSGQTARKHHDLPQNMDNQKAFDVALKFKLYIASALSALYDDVVINNICEDNHSSSFGYIANSAFKTAAELMLKNISVVNHRRFINHYRVGNNVFIITHGKDSEHLKFGFSPKLDARQTSKIDDYIDENYLLSPDVRIEFSKGDSHQMLFDWDSSTRFDYFNYPALCPSSNWIQTNYKKAPGGFVFFNYFDTDVYIPHIKKFKWVNE